MPSDKKTTPERPRSVSGQRPAQTTNRAGTGSNANQTPGRPQRPEKRGGLHWKNIAENIGWGLVIGLPVILVILAILWRATNGFQGNGDTATAQPTPVATATAGAYLAPPTAAGNKDRVLYLQAPTPNDTLQIFSAKQDGTDVVQVTNSGENKTNPTWSPDGKQIAFQADGAGIELVNLDGSGLHTVSYDGIAPVFSPDGSQIAFIKSVPAADGQGPDGTGTVRVLYVTKTTAKPGDEKQLAADATGPSWSPDSKTIAFFSLRNAVMFTVDASSGKTAQINTPNKLGGWYPTFSPDGKSIVFYGDPNPAAMVAGLDLSITSSPATDNVPTPTAAPTIPVVPATATATQGAVTATSAAQAPSTPGITVPGATSAVAGAPATPPTPTAIPGPPSQISLYIMGLDGSNLKKLQDLEPVGGGGKFRFDYYVATSADVTTVASEHPYFKPGPLFSPDGKTVATLYIGTDNKASLAVVPVDGSAATLLANGQNNLENGSRLSPSYSGDSTKLFYIFVPSTTNAATASPSSTPTYKQGRAFDLSGKTEKTILGKADNSYLLCCGLKKS